MFILRHDLDDGNKNIIHYHDRLSHEHGRKAKFYGVVWVLPFFLCFNEAFI